MKTTFPNLTSRAASALTLLAILILEPSTAPAQGSLTPPGAPGPAMVTLQQIEPRTPISSVPFVIRQPGSYYLTTNVVSSTGDAIDIATNGVTLDLNGFTISSTLNPANGIAIGFNTGVSDITILNGHIVSGVTNNAGVFSGTGFGYGIYGSSVSRVRVVGVSVEGVQYDGIYLVGDSTVADSCMARTVGSYGIIAAEVSHCTAYICGGVAVSGTTASDCYGDDIGNGDGIDATMADNCYGVSSGSGDGIDAYTANNCYGSSYGSGTGLLATSANNCYGTGDSGYGLDASSAQNSYGNSTTGYGIYATAANNCFGFSSYTTGIYTYIGSGCYGESFDNGYGIYAVNIALACYGYSVSGTGLHATIAESCSGTSLNITHNLNSY